MIFCPLSPATQTTIRDLQQADSVSTSSWTGLNISSQFQGFGPFRLSENALRDLLTLKGHKEPMQDDDRYSVTIKYEILGFRLGWPV